jgi:hypothetical protein
VMAILGAAVLVAALLVVYALVSWGWRHLK